MRSKSKAKYFVCACLVSALVPLVGCNKSPAEKPAAKVAEAKPEMRSSSVVGSDQAVSVQALLDSIRVRVLRGDTVGLARLIVDDTVFRRNVYPVSPAYDSTRESVFTFVLGLHRANNAKGLRRLLGDVSDKTKLGEVTFLVVPPSSKVQTAEGTLHEISDYSGLRSGIQLSGSILCRKQGCQVVSYAPAGAKGDNP